MYKFPSGCESSHGNYISCLHHCFFFVMYKFHWRNYCLNIYLLVGCVNVWFFQCTNLFSFYGDIAALFQYFSYFRVCLHGGLYKYVHISLNGGMDPNLLLISCLAHLFKCTDIFAFIIRIWELCTYTLDRRLSFG